MPKSKLSIIPEAKHRKVEGIYLVLSENGDGEEVYVIHGPDDQLLPLVAIDDDAVAVLTDYAQDAANNSGKIVSIIRFTRETVYETVRPLSTGDQ